MPFDGPSGAPSEIAPGAWVDHFRIRRLLGQGGMGAVYLARDGVLGRQVAIKTIRPDRLSPTRIERLMAEARLTARLSHLHVVVVHQVGMHHGAPYIAMEYLPGESLSDRLARRPPGLQESLRWMAEIASAVAHAHALGVLHRDVKPANVIIPSDGRVRVVDFGLGAWISEEPGATAPNAGGTPGYMAPEQVHGGPTTKATDVFGLGRTLETLLERVTEPVPKSAEALVAACRARDPEARPSAAEVEARLRELLLRVGRGTSAPDAPFRGLEPFDQRHASHFFGRELEVASFVERLERAPLLGVVGASGAGKSSFVRAGVVPRLEEQGRWLVLTLRPGERPFRTLAARLLGDGSSEGGEGAPKEEVEGLAERLAATPGVLHLELERLAQEKNARVLLFVDQLEELFTQVRDVELGRRFLEAVLGAADDPEEGVRVTFTLRDDFLGRMPGDGALPFAVIRAMSPEALRRAVLEPVALAGHAFEDDAMVEELASAAGAEAGMLPLVQLACRLLWDRRDVPRKLLTRAALEGMGGVIGALADHADAELSGLTPAHLRVAKALLSRLVGPENTRLPAARSELEVTLGTGASLVIERLLSARLLIARGSADGEAMLELVHEALITRWERLRRWLDESREARVLAAELSQAAALWRRRGSRPEETWVGEALQDALANVRRLDLALPEEVATFLEASRARDEQVRRRRRFAMTATVSLSVAVALGAATAALELQRRNASLQRAAANIGLSTLRITAFDWDSEAMAPVDVPVDRFPDLTWTLHAPDPDDHRTPGPLLEAGIAKLEDEDGAPVWQIETRGGPAFLKLTGRGTPVGTAPCHPSVIPIAALPGYAQREAGLVPRLEVMVPSCQASTWNLIEVPGGPFYMGGPGVPPTQHDEEAGPLTEVDLPTFWMWRTETSNAEFAAFARMEMVTGVAPRSYPKLEDLETVADALVPVTNLDVLEAGTYCAFHGLALPSEEEWTKAARGGLWLDHQRSILNPLPQRSYPWGEAVHAAPANLEGDLDGYSSLGPIAGFGESPSPYGFLNLAGNAGEWTTTYAIEQEMLVVRGGTFADPPAAHHHSILYRNYRKPSARDFGTTVRCAIGGL